MKDFLTQRIAGPFRAWHALTALLALYVLCGPLLAALALHGGLKHYGPILLYLRTGHAEAPLSPRAFLVQQPPAGARVRGLYWLYTSNVDEADYSLSVTSLGERDRLITVKVERASPLGQRIYEDLKDGIARDRTFKLLGQGREIRIVGDD